MSAEETATTLIDTLTAESSTSVQLLAEVHDLIAIDAPYVLERLEQEIMRRVTQEAA